MTEDTTLSILQACTLAGVSRRTIYNWMRDDKVSYIRTAGGRVRIVALSLFRAGNVELVVDAQPKVTP